MLDHCPGAANLRTPTLSIKKCPQCGEEVELFSNDISVKCSTCGFVVYNEIESCIQWCKHAKECVGDEMYRKLMERKNTEQKNFTVQK
jgi:NADH pyrophosphatase NudC (nudix superfamily)